MLSNRVAPEGTSLQSWTLASGLNSNCRRSVSSRWNSGSQSAIVRSPGIRTRAGRVLMNMPAISSTPGSSTGRPDEVTPNTTSSLPEYRDSSRDHAAWKTVFTVSLRSLATSSSRVASSAGSTSSRRS
nr:hypothetical protein [Amycolatopsis sp. YIM 10]